IDSFISLAGGLGFIHAGVGPPATRTPKTIAFRHRIAYKQIIRRSFDRRALKPGVCIKGYPTHRHTAGGIRPEAVEVTVNPVTHFMAVECPVPAHTVFKLHPLYGRAVEQIRLVARVSNHRRPPPIS